MSLPISAFTAGSLAISALVLPLQAQIAPTAAPPSTQPTTFDPSDVYFQGWLATRDAEKLEADGDFIGAQEKLERAAKLFDTIRMYYPDWKKDMVSGRHQKTTESVLRVRPKADELRLKNQQAVAELEGGTRMSGRVVPAGKGTSPSPVPTPPVAPPPPVPQVDPLATQRLSRAEAEVRRLQQLIDDSKIRETEASRNASRVHDLEAQRNLLDAQLKQAQGDLAALRARLAAAPVQSELNILNQRIDSLEKEREAMGMALTQSRRQEIEAKAKIATLEADLKLTQQKAVDLQRNLDVQTRTTGEVVAGQRAQLKELQDSLKAKDQELATANSRISGLEQKLEESHAAFSQLQGERDSLIHERNRMSELLKLNEAGRIQQLIEQNMGLARQLRDANTKVENLNLDSNATKDELTDALRDLAIAKSQINKLHREKREQDEQITDLEKRLKIEEANLAASNSKADPAEAETLREIIKKHLRVQERRRQARELLVDAVKQMGTKGDSISQAIEMLDGAEIALSPEEQKLIAGRADGELVSPVAEHNPQRAKAALNSLNVEQDSYAKAAEKAFLANRLMPARELYEMMIEDNPGNTAAVNKLGVVLLKLNDPMAAADSFRRAAELDAKNPYAHRMLGVALMMLNDLSGAEQALQKALELAPDDARSRVVLGSVFFRSNREHEAEGQFKAAIAADPMPSEPYYNLAFLYAREGRKEDARKYYQDALERGALPDPSLERRLN
jgi:Flp pilus assembly protein TadD